MSTARFCPQCRAERVGELRFCASCGYDFLEANPAKPPTSQTNLDHSSLVQATVRSQAQGCFSYLGFFIGGGLASAAWLWIGSGLVDMADTGQMLIYGVGAFVVFLVGGWVTATAIQIRLAPKL